jgi:hypothetical protein
LAIGIALGHCTPPWCSVHNDGYPGIQAELTLRNEGIDPCVIVVRIGKPDDWLDMAVEAAGIEDLNG